MVVGVSFSILAGIVFLFLFWKKLKDDYAQNQIFTTGFYSIIGALIFGITASKFLVSWSFWAALTGSFLGLLIGMSRFRLRMFESLEAWTFGNIGVYFVFYIFQSILYFTVINIIGGSISLVLIILFVIIDKHYKKFTWYRSGRVGFTGLFMLGLFFLVRVLVAMSLPGMIFFVGTFDVIFSGIISFTGFLMLFNLSRQEN